MERIQTNNETREGARLVGPLSDRAIRRILKPLVFAASLSPVAFLIWDALTHQFNVNPFNAIVRSTGFWSLRFLCLTLAITPLRWLTGWHSVMKFRRMIGQFGFFYGTVHTAAYVLFDRLAGLAASLFRHRARRVRVDGAAGGDVQCRHDATSWRTPLAGAAPARVSSGRRQYPAYLLASDPARSALRGDHRHVVRSTTRSRLRTPAGFLGSKSPSDRVTTRLDKDYQRTGCGSWRKEGGAHHCPRGG